MPDSLAEAIARQSPLLTAAGFSHAFFTRRGGVSSPPWATLSFSLGVGDAEEAVAENRRRAAKKLGVREGRLYYLSQNHGVGFQILDGSEDPAEVVHAVGDMTASRASGVACGVRTADCVPVLLGDRTSGAVVAIHSGWRGTVANIAKAGVTLLHDVAGAAIDPVAAIGPHIERCCFEVGEDVAAELAACSRAQGVVFPSKIREDKRYVDLRAIVRAQLEEALVAPSAVDDVAGCTVCEVDELHSFRRDGKRSGRLLAAIVARSPLAP